MKLVTPADGQYGAPTSNGSDWTGMIGMVYRKEADIALDMISVTGFATKL